MYLSVLYDHLISTFFPVNRIARQGLIGPVELGHCAVAAESSTVTSGIFSLAKEADEYRIIISKLKFFF
jgi:hypothetical protein